MQESPLLFKVAAGPFIVENGQVLLVKEQKPWGTTPWILPGGKVEQTDANLFETAKREAREELGISVELGRPLTPVIRHFEKSSYILIALVATRDGAITPGHDIVEYGWHDLHNLPGDVEESITSFVREYLAL